MPAPSTLKQRLSTPDPPNQPTLSRICSLTPSSLLLHRCINKCSRVPMLAINLPRWLRWRLLQQYKARWVPVPWEAVAWETYTIHHLQSTARQIKCTGLIQILMHSLRWAINLIRSRWIRLAASMEISTRGSIMRQWCRTIRRRHLCRRARWVEATISLITMVSTRDILRISSFLITIPISISGTHLKTTKICLCIISRWVIISSKTNRAIKRRPTTIIIRSKAWMEVVTTITGRRDNNSTSLRTPSTIRRAIIRHMRVMISILTSETISRKILIIQRQNQLHKVLRALRLGNRVTFLLSNLIWQEERQTGHLFRKIYRMSLNLRLVTSLRRISRKWTSRIAMR